MRRLARPWVWLVLAGAVAAAPGSWAEASEFDPVGLAKVSPHVLARTERRVEVVLG